MHSHRLAAMKQRAAEHTEYVIFEGEFIWALDWVELGVVRRGSHVEQQNSLFKTFLLSQYLNRTDGPLHAISFTLQPPTVQIQPPTLSIPVPCNISYQCTWGIFDEFVFVWRQTHAQSPIFKTPTLCPALKAGLLLVSKGFNGWF